MACRVCGGQVVSRSKSQPFCSKSCSNRGRTRRPFAERFWARVKVNGADECWPWDRPHVSTGYGRFWVDGRQSPAHRIAFGLTFDCLSVIGHYVVMHKCDNPACCNPAHLMLGTVADNNRDRAQKGRSCRGERHHSAKLTDDQVVAIRARDTRSADLAREYGVSYQTVYNIRKNIKRRA